MNKQIMKKYYKNILPKKEESTNTNLTKLEQKIGTRWDQSRKEGIFRTGWMQNPFVLQKINRNVGGINGRYWSDGVLHKIKNQYPEVIPFKRAISVACGVGNKEIRLAKKGLIDSFDLYEYASDRAERGERLAVKAKVKDKIKFHIANAFDANIPADTYDLVYWNNALHHMFDVHEAIAWSKKILKPGGIFYMDDYVGENRFQFSDQLLQTVNQVRATLPSYFYESTDDYTPRPRIIKRPDPEKVAQNDPSEAVDSQNILQSISNVFPNAEIIPLTSGVYRLTRDLFPMINQNNKHILELISIIDEMLLDKGIIHWAAAIAQK